MSEGGSGIGPRQGPTGDLLGEGCQPAFRSSCVGFGDKRVGLGLVIESGRIRDCSGGAKIIGCVGGEFLKHFWILYIGNVDEMNLLGHIV